MSIYKIVRNWRWVILRGLFAVLFVLAAFFGTHFTLIALVLFFGAYALIDGFVLVLAGLVGPRGPRPAWLLLLEGLLAIGAGGLALLSPSLAAIALLYLLASWAGVRGALEVTAAIRLLGAAERRRLVKLSLVFILVAGALLVIWPRPAGLSLIWLSGAYVLLFGLLQIALGLRLRNWQVRWMRPLHLRAAVVRVGPVPDRRMGPAFATLGGLSPDAHGAAGGGQS
jgi:uncharacterized membrane protein HdeD (DUF308 family)